MKQPKQPRGDCRVVQCRKLFPKRSTKLCSLCGKPACKYHMSGWSSDKPVCTACVLDGGREGDRCIECGCPYPRHHSNCCAVD